MSMEYEYSFEVTTPVLEVEEVADHKILHGVFLKLESTTGNGRTYQIEEGEQIAKSLHGMPVYYGAKLKIDPSKLKAGFKHAKTKVHEVGRVIRTVFDKLNKLIRGSVKIWATEKFPDLLTKVRNGWGFSIGGRVREYLHTGRINKFGNPVVRAIGMICNHLQLLAPSIPRGQKEAQVTDVEETINFDPCPWGLCEIPPVREARKNTLIRRTIIYTDDPDTEITFGIV